MDKARKRLEVYLVIFIMVMLIGVFGIAYTENLPLVDAFYFTIVTAATVGYGDISPKTPAGKVLTIFLILGGVGTFLGVIAGFTELFLSRREDKKRSQKLHMVTSLFFSELGTPLLKSLVQMDPAVDQKRQALQTVGTRDGQGLKDIETQAKNFSYVVEFQSGRLSEVLRLIESRTAVLLRLLENPLVLEEDRLGDLLQAIFHLRDEMINRSTFENLPPADCRHLAGDLSRVYERLVLEWLRNLLHLEAHYPYLCSLTLRTNPFNPDAAVIIEA